MDIVEAIVERFERLGGGVYGERVSQREHALQAAYEAERAGAPAPLVVAALLHDIGHLLGPVRDAAEEPAEDLEHERVGAAYLARHFVPEVVEPVRLHVMAKRYLCATDPAYARGLSEASVLSLALQGGSLAGDEIALFERLPYFREAVLVRRWDDLAKVPGLSVPDLAHYRNRLTAALRSAGDRR